MTRKDELLLDRALEAMRAQEPESAEMDAAAERVSGRLGLNLDRSEAAGLAMGSEPIESCADVRRLLAAYRAGTLTAARSMLIEAHLRDCGDCLRHSHGVGAAAVDWSVPKAAVKPESGAIWKPRRLGWGFAVATAATVALATGFLLVYQAYWMVPPGVRAEVLSVEGATYRIFGDGSGTEGRQLAAGDRLAEGEKIRTGGGGHAVLKLADGSTVEVNERSVLGVGARGRSMTVSLDDGAVVVEAAKRTSGHLFLKTPDCRVAVTGTVFTVNAGVKGSRVGVLEGSVDVEHLGSDSIVAAGGQFETSGNLSPVPVDEQIAWSHDREKLLPLLAQFSELRAKIGQIPEPSLRYSSDLLRHVPADTLLFVSIPNLGDFLSQADRIFDEQLKQSPALQQWWSKDGGRNTAELDALIGKIHQASQYLGSEIVVVGVKQGEKPGFAVLADVQKEGFGEFLRTQLPASGSALTVFDEQSLASAKAAAGDAMGGYAMIGARHAIFSNSVATLKQLEATWQATDTGFSAGEFGQQIQAAYTRGAGVILAADLHRMIPAKLASLHVNHVSGDAVSATGMDGVEYLIAEHREVNGQPENHLNVQFAGTRQRVASWLGAPAPMDSLSYVSPNASVAVAALSKDPKEIADDLIAMTSDGQAPKDGAGQAGNAIKDGIRDNIAANLGGEFLLALDGPVLPTPSWKAVVEVRDAAKLESMLESLSNLFREKEKPAGANDTGFRGFQIDSALDGERRYYSLRNLATNAVLAEYTFAGGYMIVAPSRPLLIAALKAHESGDSLARSTAFKALLPKDEHDNYSAIAYQNLAPVMTPLLAEFSGGSADVLRKLAADAKPTAVCAWGRDNRIEAESDSRLLGFDFLTLGALMSGNHPAAQAVQE